MLKLLTDNSIFIFIWSCVTSPNTDLYYLSHPSNGHLIGLTFCAYWKNFSSMGDLFVSNTTSVFAKIHIKSTIPFTIQ